MTLVPSEAIIDIAREINESAQEVYDEAGPLIEDDLKEISRRAMPYIVPILEELARAGTYRAGKKGR